MIRRPVIEVVPGGLAAGRGSAYSADPDPDGADEGKVAAQRRQKRAKERLRRARQSLDTLAALVGDPEATEKIRDALRAAGGNAVHAARILGLTTHDLHRELDARGLRGEAR